MHRRGWLYPLLVALICAVMFHHGATLLIAQENVGKIVGAVNDPSGARVPGATVTARSTSTGVQLEAPSSSDGTYVFPSLPIGEYTLSATSTGFKTLERENVRVVAGVTLTIDFQLELGNTAQSVVVKATTPAVETSVTNEGTTRVTEEVNELPLLLNGGNRNAVDFLETLPGVNVPVVGAASIHVGSVPVGGIPSTTGIETTTINGAPEGGASLTIDGVMGSVAGSSQLRIDFSPPPEAIAELRLNATDTSEYGWNSGVGVTVVTKSGTNQLHGDLFEYFRNQVLNSRNFFAASADPAKQNEYGFTLGGPVYLPKIYNGKDKTFFFVVYSGYRYRTAPQGTIISVPTAQMRQGDFSQLLPGTQLYDGVLTTFPNPADPGTFTRQPFPGNIIPLDRESKVSNYLQGSFQLPNLPGFLLNHVGPSISTPVSSDKGSFKIDQNLGGGRQRITFAYDKIDLSSVNGGTYVGAISNGSLNAVDTWTSRLAYVASLSPTLVMSLRVALNRNVLSSSGMGAIPQAENAGTLSGYTGNFSTQMPEVTITDFSTFGPPSAGYINTTQYTVPANADLTWSRGSHTLKIGAAFVSSNSVIDGCESCSGTALYLPFFTSMFFPSQGYGYADFFLGYPLNLSEATPSSNKFETEAWGLYFQDSWRVNHKLTMNYGVRWDRYDLPHESYNRLSVMDPTIINTQAGGVIGGGPGNWPGALAFFGKGPGRNGLTSMAPPDNEWGPRLGLAYAVTPKTVVRASAGLSSNAMFGLLESGASLNGEPGYTWDPSLYFYSDQYGQLAGPCNQPYTYVSCPYGWDGGFPAHEPTLPNLNPNQANTIAPAYWNTKGIRAGYSENFNFGIEHEVRGILLKAAYVGNMSHHMPIQRTIGDMDPKYLSLGPLLDDAFGSAPVVAAGIQPKYAGLQGQVWRGLLPWPQYAYVDDIADPIGVSSYNAFQASVQKRFGNGLSFLISYTDSKELTNYGSYSGQGVASQIVQNSRFGSTAKSLAAFDRPQNLTLSYVYELPFGPGKRFGSTSNAVVRALIEDWRVSGIDIYTSGNPISLSSGGIVDGMQGIWPLREGGVPGTLSTCGTLDPGNPSQSLYLNPAAYVNPPNYTVGNVSTLPNIRNCPYFNEDLSVQRLIKIREKVDFLFSIDSSNLFNRHSWVGLEGNISETAAFGRVSGATDPRELQLHAKFEF